MTTKAAKKAPAKKAPKAVEEPTPVSSWKKKPLVLTLPSGVSARVRRTSFQAFMKMGIVPNSLMSIAQDAINKGVAIQEVAASAAGENIDDLLEMVDGIVMFCLVEPKVHPTPENEDDRDDETLYIDEVDDEDKMFLMQWATGGTDDVAQFRSENRDVLDALRAG